jgi:hypothetical protein
MNKKYIASKKYIAREVMRQALLHVSKLVYKMPIEELRTKEASLLTGMNVITGEPQEMNWIKVEAHRRFREYVRGNSNEWDETWFNHLVRVHSLSVCKTFALIMNLSIMDLVGDGCCSTGRDGESQKLIEEALDIITSFRTPAETGGFAWLTRVGFILFHPVSFFIQEIEKGPIFLEDWKESEKYVQSLKDLGGLVYWTVNYDRWLRELTSPKDACEWNYRNDIYKKSEQYDNLFWSDIIDEDEHAIRSFLIMLSLNDLKEVDVKEGLKIDLGTLKNHVEKLEHAFKEALGEEAYKESKVREVLSKMSSGRGVADPLKSIASLWNGWVGSMFTEVAEASLTNEALYLRMKKPSRLLPHHPFDVRTFMWLTVYTLPVSRQVAHIYSHTGRLFVERAKREGSSKVAKKIDERLGLLCSRESGWASDKLRQIPPRPLPSIYEQILHVPAVMVGMVYSVLSSLSTLVGLDPEIPPDPLGLFKLDPVKEKWGEEWSKLTARPEFSESLDLLRSSARLPIGHLEQIYDRVEAAMKLLPPPAGP